MEAQVQNSIKRLVRKYSLGGRCSKIWQFFVHNSTLIMSVAELKC